MPKKVYRRHRNVVVARDTCDFKNAANYRLWSGDVLDLLPKLAGQIEFDLVVTSPPYNLGKEYEERLDLDAYLQQQKEVISAISPMISNKGSICWQTGNFVDTKGGSIIPLDILIYPIFDSLGFKLRNRIVWHFGHGLHSRRRFSGRYETILWFSKSDDYYFDLDAVRVPAKYPGKRHYKGPKKGQYSSNPRGKNPEDVWDIPNVKSNHVEKTEHPCQFPIGLVERLILALTAPDDLVFDPFCGVGSAGVAAAIHNRRFLGSEIVHKYVDIAAIRIREALVGTPRYRPHDKPIYDHRQSTLSVFPGTA